MASYVSQNFLPVKVHIKEQPATFHRFGAQWTPTMIVLDPEGKERYRFEGYLPADEYLAQLELGLAKIAFAHLRWAEAEQHYRRILQEFPNTEAAAQALYWAGVSRYKATQDPAPLMEAAQQLKQKYPDSIWAKKASVWLEEKRAAG